MRKRALTMIFAAFMALSVAACGNSTSPQDSTGGDAAETQQETPEKPEEPAQTDSGAVGDYDVTIGDCAFGTDYEGNKMIVVNYDFTNNSEETIAPLWALSVQAFQDGVQLDVAIALDTSVYDAGVAQKELKPGASMTGCQSAFVLTSESPVEVEVAPLIGDPVLFKTFEVA